MAFNAITIRVVRGRDPILNSGNADDSDIHVTLDSTINSYQPCTDLVAAFSEILTCSVDFEFSQSSIEIAIASNLGFEEQEALREAIIRIFKAKASNIRLHTLGWA